MSVKPLKGKSGFILKLEAILSNQQLFSVVSWSYSGNSFLILDASSFESNVLAKYFRHKRMSSFIRQLNMYGFHKQRSEKEALQFYHPFFQKERPDLFAYIERKKASQLSFKENLPDNNSKESQSELFLSDKCIPSIKMIEPESELNGSKMTIRLNEALTSLCDVQIEEEDIQELHIGSVQAEPFLEGKYSISKNEGIEDVLIPINEQERQINFL